MLKRRRSPTEALTRNALVLAPKRPFVRDAVVALLTVVCVSGALALVPGFQWPGVTEQVAPVGAVAAAPPPVSHEVDELDLKITALQDALNKATLELGVERATRVELESQIDALKNDLMKAKEKLAFLEGASEAERKR